MKPMKPRSDVQQNTSPVAVLLTHAAAADVAAQSSRTSLSICRNTAPANALTIAYRVGRKSKLSILSEYVNKTEKMGGM